MKVYYDIYINGKDLKAGDEISWLDVYPLMFFMIFAFGGLSLYLAYFEETDMAYLWGGFTAYCMLIPYTTFFGDDRIYRMLIDGAMSAAMTYGHLGWFLGLFGKNFIEYHYSLHVVPFVYTTYFLFLFRRGLIDLFRVRESKVKKWIVESSSTVILLGINYMVIF